MKPSKTYENFKKGPELRFYLKLQKPMKTSKKG
jgi:hypothetical protein